MMCKRTKIAGNENFKVDLCKCGAIHLAVGFTTLRLDSDAYSELVHVLYDGLRAIRDGASRRPTVH